MKTQNCRASPDSCLQSATSPSQADEMSKKNMKLQGTQGKKRTRRPEPRLGKMPALQSHLRAHRNLTISPIDDTTHLTLKGGEPASGSRSRICKSVESQFARQCNKT
jgi:hypothetical protein